MLENGVDIKLHAKVEKIIVENSHGETGVMVNGDIDRFPCGGIQLQSEKHHF